MPPADPGTAGRLNATAYKLSIRQQPERAKVATGGKEKDRKAIDPPPMVQLKVLDPQDPAQNYLQSPYYLVACNLWHETEERPIHDDEKNETPLVGSLVSSLHRLKDTDNADGGFFVFGDVSVKVEGAYRLKFTLFEILSGQVVSLQSALSNVFHVYSGKNFPGMSESTFISRSFGDQGVRIRIRKENRKRPASRDNSTTNNRDYGDRDTATPTQSVGVYGGNGYASAPKYYEEGPAKRARSSASQGDAYENGRPQWAPPYSQAGTPAVQYAPHSTAAQYSNTAAPVYNHGYQQPDGYQQHYNHTDVRYQETNGHIAQPNPTRYQQNTAEHLYHGSMSAYPNNSTPRSEIKNEYASPDTAYSQTTLPPMSGSMPAANGKPAVVTPYYQYGTTAASPSTKAYVGAYSTQEYPAQYTT